MDIMIRLFLLMYLLAMVLVTMLSVIWIMTSVFTLERTVKNSLVDNSKRI